MPELGGNGHGGKGQGFVVEACEFNRSFHNLRPFGAAILNLDHDHFDCYPSTDELIEAFAMVCRENDTLYILPVFFAGGTVRETDDAEQLVSVLRARGVNARYVYGYGSLAAEIRPKLQPGDAVLGMGARDPELPEFLRAVI